SSTNGRTTSWPGKFSRGGSKIRSFQKRTSPLRPKCSNRSGWPILPMSSTPRLLPRSEEHTSELQSLRHLVCRLLLEKKKSSNPCFPKHSPTLCPFPLQKTSLAALYLRSPSRPRPISLPKLTLC